MQHTSDLALTDLARESHPYQGIDPARAVEQCADADELLHATKSALVAEEKLSPPPTELVSQRSAAHQTAELMQELMQTAEDLQTHSDGAVYTHVSYLRGRCSAPPFASLILRLERHIKF